MQRMDAAGDEGLCARPPPLPPLPPPPTQPTPERRSLSPRPWRASRLVLRAVWENCCSDELMRKYPDIRKAVIGMKKAVTAPNTRERAPVVRNRTYRRNDKTVAGWDRMLKRILGLEQRQQRSDQPPLGSLPAPGLVTVPAPALAPAPASGPVPVPAPTPAAALRGLMGAHGSVAPTAPTATFSVTPAEVDDPIKQMRKLSRDWILTALNTPNSMQQIVIQLRHIVEGFWPFNNPLLMNVPHPDLVYIIAEELQQILVKCEAKTLGYPSVAAQPRSLPHFCNFVLLLGHFIVEFASLPYKMSDHLMDIAFRSTVLCLQPPLQWQLAHALFRLWRMAGREMEMHLSGFNVLVDGLRDAVLLGERARPVPLDGPDPKTLFVEALELRARGWRPQSKSGDGDRAGACSPAPVGDSSATALTEALARASLRVENLGAAGDCPRTAGLSGPGVLAL